MREIITIVICAVVFLVALQSGLVKTGLDYEVVRKNNENLQAANERLSSEIKRINQLGKNGAEFSEEQVAVMERLEKAKEDLKNELSKEIKRREVTIEENNGAFSLVILDRILFSKQSDKILSTSFSLLEKIAKVLGHFDGMEIQILGYTNNEPLSPAAKKTFSSLLSLSTARAISVLNFFTDKGSLDPVQMMAAGFGDSRPVVPNDSDYHRTLNGRVVVNLLPASSEMLNKARDIYRTEKLIPAVKGDKKAQEKNSSDENASDPAEQPIGGEALDSIEGNDFDAGYEVPDALK